MSIEYRLEAMPRRLFLVSRLLWPFPVQERKYQTRPIWYGVFRHGTAVRRRRFHLMWHVIWVNSLKCSGS
jgi:mannose/cellobiose epimerase-like protein (N-acyl-D-glucosamine 2-epimerase family)